VSVLAIDAGTTGVTALVVDESGAVLGRGYSEFPQHFPHPGWVEHDPEQIWEATLSACAQALRETPAPVAIGLTNQRETLVCWDRASLAAVRPAIVWQDRRSSEICRSIREAGHEPRLAAITGLRLDPYFTATKIAWIAAHDQATWEGIRAGRVALGTVDAYLVARLTAGGVEATDPSNASRTLLYDLALGGWSEEAIDLFGIPRRALPEIRPSSGDFGRSDPGVFLGLELPIRGVAGDQQAALFGQACYASGTSKCTYGTGSFVLVNTGSQIVRSTAGLLTTVAWDLGGGPTHALEGSVFVTGAAVQWLRDGLGIIASAAETEALARSVRDSAGVVFVPALTGLGAPHWDADARGAVFGLTRGTTRAHVVRATLEAIAFEVRDVLEAIVEDTAHPVPELSVDGGAAANDLLCAVQADVLQVPVRRPQVLETTALGAAFLAGLAAGVWASTDELVQTWRLDRSFEPGPPDELGYARWREAVARVRGFPVVDEPAGME
jgi:glycerol kinase